MMSLWDALRMNMMISYQELVRTFPSTLNIRFRRADYVGLAVISSGLGVVSACWFAMGLLGITMADITAIWHNIESVMIEEMNQTPPQWPMILT